ncbi:hypothetical protein K525DRAFT_262399, partial [Schizophyllum commune Loenen D]
APIHPPICAPHTMNHAHTHLLDIHGPSCTKLRVHINFLESIFDYLTVMGDHFTYLSAGAYLEGKNI